MTGGVDDFAAGFGDFVSIGATRWFREASGSNGTVDENSGAYIGGEALGFVGSLPSMVRSGAAGVRWVAGGGLGRTYQGALAFGSRGLGVLQGLHADIAGAARLIPLTLPAPSSISVTQFGLKVVNWIGGGVAKFTESAGRVTLDLIRRGGAPAGHAGDMLAEALRAAEVLRPAEIYVPNILQKTAQSTELLTNLVRQAVARLGGTVTSLETGVELGKTYIRVGIGY